MNDKNIDSQLESSCFKELEHLKRQMTKLQCTVKMNMLYLINGIVATDFKQYY